MHADPLPGTPARAKALNRHVQNLTSSNQRRQQAAITHLNRMNLTPTEHLYVQSQVHHRQNPTPKLPAWKLASPAVTNVGGKAPKYSRAQARAIQKNVEQSPQAKTNRAAEKYVKGPYAREQAQLAAMVNPLSHENVSNFAEDLTGYREIRNIRKNPIAGGIALAGITPIGKVGHILEEGRALEAGAQAVREGKGLRGALATRQAVKAARRGARMGSEEAHAQALDLARQARERPDVQRAMHRPNIKLLKPGEVTAETGGKQGQIIRHGLSPNFKGMGQYEKIGAKLDNPGVAELRKQQEILRAAERSKKAGALRGAQVSAKTWEQLGKAGAARGGDLSKGVFRGFQGLKEGAQGHNFLPSEEHLAANPRDRFIPVLYHDGHVTVGEPGGSHADFPKGEGVQGYAVIENGKVHSVNFSSSQAAQMAAGAKAPGDITHFIDQYDRNPDVQRAVKNAVESKFSSQQLPHLEALRGFIQNLDLRPFEKQNLVDAINKGLEGHVPTEGEQALLERTFGRETADNVRTAIKAGGLKKVLADIMNIPRAFKASADFSWGLRQGFGEAVTNPKLFAKTFKGMFKPAFSEAEAQARMAAIHNHPLYPLAVHFGVPFTELGSAEHGVENLGSKEEQIMTNYAEHLHELPGVRSTPGLKQVAKGTSKVIRASDRAYVVPLNEIRLAQFDQYVHQALENGWNLSLDHKLGKDLAGLTGALTGRGNLPKFLATHRTTINALFFSPGLMASRINMLNPLWYARMEPFARMQALKAARNMTGTLMTLLYAARMAGAKVETDPRNSDFGKIRIGNTRIDPAAGFSQYLTLYSRLATGKDISSTTGKVTHLSGKSFGTSDWDIIQQFFLNKLAPVPSEGVTLAKRNRFGQPLTPSGEAGQMLTPLLWNDMYQLAKTKGPGGGPGIAAATFLPDLFGVGVQNYSAKKKKPTGDSTSYSGGGSYGGSGGYSGGGSYGGSGGY